MTEDEMDLRVTALEQETRRLREHFQIATADSFAARTLAAAADRDVSEVRAKLGAQLSLLNALGATQADHSRRFDRMDERFDRMDERFDRMDERFDRLASALAEHVHATAQGFQTVQAGMTQIVGLLTDRPPT